MHELSIAMHIMDIVSAEAEAAGAKGVNRIELEIGLLSGVEPDAIQLAMEEAIVDTIASQASVIFHWKKAVAVCEDCCKEFEPDDVFKICPYCNSLNTRLLTGKELKIKSIEVITE
ncbi:MAG TPA: hydrogenase maturation nickel metallochaperone HypA [Bacteroidales bacterium]|nr:hydrogenase maturation nickel metallochaperone HypA [Bacteroidales bacterium]